MVKMIARVMIIMLTITLETIMTIIIVLQELAHTASLRRLDGATNHQKV